MPKPEIAKYKALFFDADSTLLDFERAGKEALQELHGFMEQHLPFRDFFRIFERINQDIWLELEEKKIRAGELNAERFKRFVHAIGSREDAAALSGVYLRSLGEKAYYLEGAREVLTTLKGRIPMALITNGLTAVQETRFGKLGLDAFFDGIMISEREGSCKPETRIFQKAARALGLELDRDILIIGDSLTSDIAGGIAAGISTCWYNPQKWQNQSPHIPDYTISSLDELPGIIVPPS